MSPLLFIFFSFSFSFSFSLLLFFAGFHFALVEVTKMAHGGKASFVFRYYVHVNFKWRKVICSYTSEIKTYHIKCQGFCM